MNQRELILLRSLVKTAEEFVAYFWVKHPEHFEKAVKVLKKAKKLGMKLPSYLDPLTTEEKELANVAHMTLMDPKKAKLYLAKVNQAELNNIRLLILKDRIEN